MMRLRISVIAILVCASLDGTARAEVSITPEQRENFDVQTVTLSPTRIPRSWRATAQVLDPAPLLASLSDLRAARHALAASTAESERSRRLFEDDNNVARKALEAAQAQRAADEAKVVSVESQMQSTWGTALLGRLENDLRAGKASLVRVDLASGIPAGGPPPLVQLLSIEDDSRWPAEWIGRLPRTASVTLGGPILVRTSASLVNGQLLAAELRETRATLEGIRIPASAIVRWHGTEWFYVEGDDNHFSRRSLKGAPAVANERLVPVESQASVRVVRQGARSLLAAEIGGGEEASEGKAND